VPVVLLVILAAFFTYRKQGKQGAREESVQSQNPVFAHIQRVGKGKNVEDEFVRKEDIKV
jgi:hypothetical protein